jgi:formylglycine-generating enzyme required for sulfatase activity
MTQQEFEKRYTYDRTADKLGEGGFGKVFRAYDTVLDRYVAIKIAEVPKIESTRLQKEVETVTKLPPHRNIARYEECYTFSTLDGEKDIGILQYYEEGNLNQLLKADKLTDGQKRSLLLQILDGVEFLHEQKIIHRDLKPQNILIVKRGAEYIPKITDFGISKKLDVDKSSSFSNSISGIGTLAFAAPEQLRADTIRKNADLWSFGILAYRVLTGQLPFTYGEHDITSESGRQELFRQIVSGQLPQGINSVAEPWQTLIRRCLVVEPKKRAQSVGDLRKILNGTLYKEEQKEPEINNKGKEGKDADDSGETRKEQFVETKATDDSISREWPTTQKKSRKPLLYALGGAVALSLLAWLIVNIQLPARTAENDIPMVYVAGGTFTMGCTSEQGGDCYDDEKPAHSVTLSSYYIGKYEVTQAQWKAVMDSNPSYFKGDNLPVEYVSWNDVQEFIRKLNQKTGKNYRLPTEAEWEFAARGGGSSRGYKYSGSNTVGNVAWYTGNSGSKTHPVGAKQANELGIYDMSGNVWEWCSDWYGDYSNASQTNPRGISTGSLRVLRGGSWSNGAGDVRVSIRFDNIPDSRIISIGFRLALSSN